MFTTATFWFGFFAGIIFVIILAYLYNYLVEKKVDYCLSCYSDIKNERYMTWADFPDKKSRLVKCTDEWHDK
jgi:hypothetical protein